MATVFTWILLSLLILILLKLTIRKLLEWSLRPFTPTSSASIFNTNDVYTIHNNRIQFNNRNYIPNINSNQQQQQQNQPPPEYSTAEILYATTRICNETPIIRKEIIISSTNDLPTYEEVIKQSKLLAKTEQNDISCTNNNNDPSCTASISNISEESCTRITTLTTTSTTSTSEILQATSTPPQTSQTQITIPPHSTI